MNKSIFLVLGFLTSCSGSMRSNCNPNDEALQEAAEKGRQTQVQNLIQQGANPNAHCLRHVYSAFSAAARNGHLAIVQDLLQGGADIEQQDTEGFTPLMLAAKHNHLGVVNCLIQNNVDLDKQDLHYLNTALMWALVSDHAKGNMNLFNALLNASQDLSIRNRKGQTALEVAEERAEIVYDAAGKAFYQQAINLIEQQMQ